MEFLLEYLSSTPVKYTYFAIGSCPHSWGEELTESRDQLFPTFFRDWVAQHPEETFRCIHFDPCFSKQTEELSDYFMRLNIYPVESPPLENVSFWRSSTHSVEILLSSEMFHHPSAVYPGNDEWFLESLVDQVLQGEEPLNQKLVVQEFTGHEIIPLFKTLYSQSPFKHRFMKSILFDISYGVDSGCCTDMKKHYPFLTEAGDFYNLLLLAPSQLQSVIGIEKKMDVVCKYLLIREFKELLNNYHVDYRRRLRGESVLFQSGEYNDTTAANQIMASLQTRLRIVLKILFDMKHISQSNYSNCIELFENYKDHDVYKWYTTVNNTVPILDMSSVSAQ